MDAGLIIFFSFIGLWVVIAVVYYIFYCDRDFGSGSGSGSYYGGSSSGSYYGGQTYTPTPTPVPVPTPQPVTNYVIPNLNPSQVPNRAYHGTSRESAYHIFQTGFIKTPHNDPTTLWVASDLSRASGFAKDRGGSNGLIVEFALSFRPSQMVDYGYDLNGAPEHLLNFRIVDYKDRTFCIVDSYSQLVGGYARIPGVTPIRLLDQQGHQVA